MKRSKKILFVCHGARRTGAPLVLLHFLKWLKTQRDDYDFDVLLKEGGPLEKEFKNIATTYKWKSTSLWINFFDEHALWGKNKPKILHQIRRLRRLLPKTTLLSTLENNNYDLVFINSFANCDIIPDLARSIKCKFICRAPELGMAVDKHCGLNCVKSALPYISHYIAVSEIVRDYFINQLKISARLISKIPGFYRPAPLTSINKNQLRSTLKIPQNAFVVCGCGTLEWRKGPDLFLQIASHLRHLNHDLSIYFIWVGGNLNSPYAKQLLYDIEKLQLGNIINLAGNQDQPHNYFAASDIFALTSREDPFPLVALEGASVGLPIICFENAVGTAEIIDDDSGRLVPYLDVHAFAQRILEFALDRKTLKKCSKHIKKKIGDFDIDPISRKITKILDDMV